MKKYYYKTIEILGIFQEFAVVWKYDLNSIIVSYFILSQKYYEEDSFVKQ